VAPSGEKRPRSTEFEIEWIGNPVPTTARTSSATLRDGAMSAAHVRA
jgi:hypothetical protein